MTVPAGNLQVTVVNDEIIVALPFSTYVVTHYKPENSSHLIVKRSSLEDDPRPSMSLSESEFLGRAWWVAADKAHELGWIVL